MKAESNTEPDLLETLDKFDGVATTQNPDVVNTEGGQPWPEYILHLPTFLFFRLFLLLILLLVVNAASSGHLQDGFLLLLISAPSFQ